MGCHHTLQELDHNLPLVMSPKDFKSDLKITAFQWQNKNIAPGAKRTGCQKVRGA